MGVATAERGSRQGWGSPPCPPGPGDQAQHTRDSHFPQPDDAAPYEKQRRSAGPLAWEAGRVRAAASRSPSTRTSRTRSLRITNRVLGDMRIFNITDNHSHSHNQSHPHPHPLLSAPASASTTRSLAFLFKTPSSSALQWHHLCHLLPSAFREHQRTVKWSQFCTRCGLPSPYWS